MTAAAPPVLVRILRGGRTEAEHRGFVCLSGPEAPPTHACGDPAQVTALRSAAKPFQLMGVISSGAADRFGFTDPELAVMAGSHGGTPAHVAAVSSAMSKAGIPDDLLQCGIHPPFDPSAAEALVRAGAMPTVLNNNCSGKHAGMLATARHLSAPFETYLEPDHPVQRGILADLAWAAGVAPSDVGVAVDGCSAPTFFLSMAAAARAFARLASASPAARDPREAALGRVARAMAAHPEMVAGEGRFDTALARAGGVVAVKGGAEGFLGAALLGPGGPMGLAVKILDGANRAVGPAVLEALVQVGLWPGGLPASLIDRHRPVLSNHRGTAVGRIEPALRVRPV